MRQHAAIWLSLILCIGAASAQEEILYERGLKAFRAAEQQAREKKYAQAAKAYQDFARQFPDHELADDALMRAAANALRRRKPREAANCYAKLIATYPYSANVPGALASQARVLRHHLEEYVEAAKLFERLGKAVPGYTGAEGALLNAAQCYMAADDTTNALRVTDEYIATRPNAGSAVIDIRRVRIDARIRQGKLAAAEKEIAALEAISSNTAQLGSRYYTLGAAYWREKAYAAAAEMYLKAAGKTAFPHAGASLIQAAACCEKLETAEGYQRAVNLLRRYIAAYPNGERVHECWFRIGHIQLDRLENLGAGIETYDTFLRRHEESIFLERILWELARAHHEAGQLGKARARYRDLIARGPRCDAADDAMLTLADLLTREGTKAEAAALYKRIVDEYPGHAAAVQARQRLKDIRAE